MLQDNFILKGTLSVEVFDAEGKLKADESRYIDNLVVAVGKNFVADRMISATSAIMSHMAVGSGSTAPASADTTLGTELARVTLTSSTRASNVITYVATFPAGTGTGSLTEAGIFNAASAGTMLSRTTFLAVNKTALDSVTITWNVTVQ